VNPWCSSRLEIILLAGFFLFEQNFSFRPLQGAIIRFFARVFLPIFFFSDSIQAETQMRSGPFPLSGRDPLFLDDDSSAIFCLPPPSWPFLDN